MSKFDVPSEARIKAGALANRAVQACIKKPVGGCESLCTEGAILEGRPVVCVFKYGTISTSAFDAEDGSTRHPQLGELVEIRPLEADDPFHPEKVLMTFTAKLPKVRRLGKSSSPGKSGEKSGGKSGEKSGEKPGRDKPEPPDESKSDDDLAQELGLI